MKVKTDYESCDYITAGKEYEVMEDRSPTCFRIRDDSGELIYVEVLLKSTHLNDEGIFEVVK